ncbi:hypothetical protein GOP47_0030935 [Adiantum capillus-veneris]|nr:hypothetical protein GOP47_0030935 [Adiantum capillus-veneris]
MAFGGLASLDLVLWILDLLWFGIVRWQGFGQVRDSLRMGVALVKAWFSAFRFACNWLVAQDGSGSCPSLDWESGVSS